MRTLVILHIHISNLNELGMILSEIEELKRKNPHADFRIEVYG